MTSSHVLVVEPDRDFRRKIASTLEGEGLAVSEAATAKQLKATLEREDFDLVLLAVRLPDADGMELLPRILGERPSAPLILMTSFYSIPGAVEAIRLGAFDYLAKPFPPEQLTATVRKALQTGRLRLEMSRLTQDNVFR